MISVLDSDLSDLSTKWFTDYNYEFIRICSELFEQMKIST